MQKRLRSLGVIGLVCVLAFLWYQSTSSQPEELRQSSSEGAPAQAQKQASLPALPNAQTKAAAPAVLQPLDVRFPGAILREEAESFTAPHLSQRIKLFERPESVANRWLKVVETWAQAEDGDWRLTTQSVMRADRFIVQAKPGVTAEQLLNRATGSEVTLVKRRPTARIFLAELGEVSLSEFEREFALWKKLSEQGVDINPDFVRFSSATPNDSQFGQQYALGLIEAEEAWDITTGSAEVVVAVLDSGVDVDHPDLQANIWENPHEVAGNNEDDDNNGFSDDVQGWNFVNNNNNPNDIDGHGTNVAGVIGSVGNNGVGTAGVNWSVKMIPLRCGDDTFSEADLIDALDYVYDLKMRHGINIVATNNSYGSIESSNNPFFEDAVYRQEQAGILFVAAAGNDSVDNDDFNSTPANYDFPHMLSVASTTSSDALSSFSNYGAYSVHLAAPGSSILTTRSGGGYESASGTSFASPYVAGAVALLASANPGLSMLERKELILETADPISSLSGRLISGGRLNLKKLIERAALMPRLSSTSPVDNTIVLSDLNSGLLVEPDLDFEGILGTNESGQWQWELSPPSSGELNTNSLDAFSVLFESSELGEVVLTGTFTDQGYEESLRYRIKVGESSSFLEDGLVAHWKFDEGSGSVASDSAAGNHPGTVSNGTWDTGILGGALRFNGSTSRVSFSPPAVNQITLSAWVKSDSRGNSVFPRVVNMPNYYLFLGRQNYDLDPRSSVLTGNVENLKFYNERTGVSGVWHSRSGIVPDGEWLHVAATYDTNSPDSLQLYLNGEALISEAQYFSAPSGNHAGISGTAYIGNNGDLSRAWDGLIDDVRIYNRLLSESEVLALATLPSLHTAPSIAASIPEEVVKETASEIAGSINNLNESLSYQWDWSYLSGPIAPTITDANSSSPTITFPEAGTYQLRALADDGRAKAVLDISFEVLERASITVSIVASDTVALRNPLHAVTFTFTADASPDLPLNLNLSLSGEAGANIDYEPLDLNVTIPAFETQATLKLIPIGAAIEADKTLTLTLNAGDDYKTALSNTAEVTFKKYTFDNWWQRYGLDTTLTVQEALISDEDGDDFNAFTEFAFNLDPGATSFAREIKPTIVVEQNEFAENYFSLTYTRPRNIVGVDYLLQRSSDLATWSNHVDESVISTVVDQNDGTETVTIRSEVLLQPAENLFLRVGVEQVE